MTSLHGLFRLLPRCILLVRTATALRAPDPCPIFSDSPRQCDSIAPPASFLPASVTNARSGKPAHVADNRVFVDFLDALDVAQSSFFASHLGTWPDAIGWTGEVLGTHLSASTRSISEDFLTLNSTRQDNVRDWTRASNLVDKYFAQSIAYYFGQDALTLEHEAYDDMLWSVLGWLETVQFINTHSGLHYTHAEPALSEATDDRLNSYATSSSQPYHGSQWIPTFSHRARIFWDFASRGWDTTACGGGMLWSPHLEPYKNAITNELFIAASISMYLYHPGEADPSTGFANRPDKFNPPDPRPSPDVPSGPRDKRYLKAAMDGHAWLRESNMTNAHGLFIDGLHLDNVNHTACSVRDEMVFTYNQGVLLSGLRGLWDARGSSSFLADGHELIQNVINATGYDLEADTPFEDPLAIRAGVLPTWYGLGRLGVMEEFCDASGTCSQDTQTFKGIFFHHLATFCAPLEAPSGLGLGRLSAFAAVQESHASACRSYAGWLGHNVHAAMGTRDKEGKFGMWWTAGLLRDNWVGEWPVSLEGGEALLTRTFTSRFFAQEPASSRELFHWDGEKGQMKLGGSLLDDPNERGRGGTVETQSGGLALLRAYWKIARAA